MSGTPLVLNYWRSEQPPRGDENDVIPVLWPAYAWKVIVPRPRDRGLNMFQRAVLAACHAGSFPIEGLASALKLHEKLVAVVINELDGLGLLEIATGRPTEKGAALLQGDGDIWEGAQSGWFFQNRWDGQILPYFDSELVYADGEFGGETGARLMLGGKLLPAFLLTAPENRTTPTVSALAHALRSHRAREKAREEMAHTWDRELGEKGGAGGLPPLGTIELVEDRPAPVYLVTVGRVERDGVEPTLDDFFGLGEAPQQWLDLQRRAEAKESVIVVDCVHAIRLLARQQSEPTFSEHLHAARDAARHSVAQVLSPQIEKFESLGKHLVRMEVEVAAARAESEDPWRACNNARTNARKALEALLKAVEDSDPDITELRALLTNDAEANERLLNKHAGDLGFVVPLPLDLRVSDKDRAKLGGRKKRGKSYNLHLAIVALILRASQQGTHRLRTVAKLEPKFFALLLQVKDQGNQGAHDDDSAAEPTYEESLEAIELMRDDCYRVVSLLLDLPMQLTNPRQGHG